MHWSSNRATLWLEPSNVVQALRRNFHTHSEAVHMPPELLFETCASTAIE